jgi:hypothetical protein
MRLAGPPVTLDAAGRPQRAEDFLQAMVENGNRFGQVSIRVLGVREGRVTDE